ncbi:MAG: MerR family transcriptional regulator [Enterococcus raffinosus]|nr:MerR family transcriptional regulator [Enterococcus raffinosus]
MGYKISEISKKTGLSAYTLRFYDQKGLLPFVARDENGRRHFKDEDLEFLSIITCLKDTGMQLSEIKQFVEWSMNGDPTYKKDLIFLQSIKKKLKNNWPKHKPISQKSIEKLTNTHANTKQQSKSKIAFKKEALVHKQTRASFLHQ